VSAMSERERDARAGVPFVAGLRDHAGRVALIGPGGEQVGYRELATRVERLAERIGPGRKLVLLAAAHDVETIVGYLAALHGGHPVILVPAEDRSAVAAFTRIHDPDVLLSAAGIELRRAGSRHVLHPDLALLLSTSGSTGSPRLVRLSAANVQANAAAIAQYLGIAATDRAMLSLPVHYCYGLSIVNSNLLRGAAVLLPEHPLTDPRFWTVFRDARATSLHGVPYTFELLDRVGFAGMDLPGLRYVTQAGGRLPAADVVRYAELGARRGWRLFVMYGQTEATARMAYLPPELAAARPSSIGVPIPGGSFELAGRGADGVGELVYRGPNVMLGYASGPADLGLGRTVDALHTGDLARRGPDGLYELTGRASRFVKLLGLRIDLDQAERVLADLGCTAVCTGGDDALVVAVAGAQDPDRTGRLVAGRFGLPPDRVRVCVLAEFPRLPNGKIDYVAVRRRATAARATCRWRRRRPRSVRAAFRSVFGPQDLPADATFVGLGGDSLSWVRMSVAIEDVLGHLPRGWDTTTIGELEQLRPRHRAWTTMETGVVLRAVAIVLVVGSHVGLFRVLGGAHVLLVVAGWTFARFVLTPDAEGSPSPRILRSLLRIAVPSVAWIGFRAAVQPDVELHNALLLNYVLDPASWGYWYVEALVQTLLLMAVVFAVPAVRRLERARPAGVAVGALLLALAARGLAEPGNEFSDRVMSTPLVLWLFVLGWAGQRATTVPARVALLGLAGAALPGFFGEPRREVVVAVGVLLLFLVPRIVVPRHAVRAVGLVAGSSLHIYLTHYAVYPSLLGVLPAAAVVAAGVGVGIATAAAATLLGAAGSALWRSARPLRHGGPGAGPGIVARVAEGGARMPQRRAPA
jgi:acyl-CoA synthetase (AMP-forming)/AMP-acid ligase II